MNKIIITEAHLDLKRAYQDTLKREAALREELRNMTSLAMGRGDRVDSLRDRLTVAEQRVQRMIDCSKGQGSIATGYLSDILALLKPAAEKDLK